MGVSTWILLLLAHPLEFRTLVQYKIYHEHKRDISAKSEHATSGWDRPTMRRCWEFLDMTSRSFSTVIKQLDGDLARTICLFYLVLRGLDTIEDDMTISQSVKQPILRQFHKFVLTRGWTFTESGPNEKDRQLLVEFSVVVDELYNLPEADRDVIVRICSKMEVGMADYVARAAGKETARLDSIAEYDLYCHYVAGLVGEGLSALFSASGKERADLAGQLVISNSFGLLLQKTNITRDYREDVDDKRYFWPREIYAEPRYGGSFSCQEEMIAPPEGTKWDPDVKQRALWVQSAMVVDALRHTTDVLDYLRMLKNQSVFNFCAIPATMAMATLELCFMNPRMFLTNIKIRKASAASLIMRSKNPREVSIIFREYARKMHARAVPADPNFIRLSVACGKIEQWCEHYYPSFVTITDSVSGGVTQSISAADVRGRTFLAAEKADAELAQKARVEAIRARANANGGAVHPSQEISMRELSMYVGGALLAVSLIIAFVVLLIVRWSD
ncbi:isoprenoid synthase domain-containing protein [Mycena pura]|uniref:Squalene synthase n=1 Tax=Mycena pura TaxID=153505 RepID=A0AAD6Y9G4_9AGAR|nr:isoprenoid synthase domain-containing protein [Mycena pura]